jgi:uncharacterized membrane protein YdjX (TVP38/TMEM64 family)
VTVQEVMHHVAILPVVIVQEATHRAVIFSVATAQEVMHQWVKEEKECGVVVILVVQRHQDQSVNAQLNFL